MKKLYNLVKYSYLFTVFLVLFKYIKLPGNRHIVVKSVKGKGEGLFTQRNISKGAICFIAKGPVRFAHFEGDDCYLYPDWYAVDKDIWIDIKPPFVKVNHSCNPNLGILHARVFIALRDIVKDEELTFDYSFTDDEPNWIMGRTKCLCGETNCRGLIRSTQFISKEYFDRSFPYISPYFISVYNNKELSTKNESIN